MSTSSRAIPRGSVAFGLGLVAALALGWWGLPRMLYEREDQPLQFNHALHAGDAVGLSCADCHGFDARGRFTGVPGVEACAACHREALGNSNDEARLVQAIADGHELRWKVYARQPDNTYFSHATHIRLAELPCERCHGAHGSTESLRPFQRNRISGYSRDIWGSRISGFGKAAWDGMKMNDCSHCHRRNGVVESCLDCHK